jgi:hypothetical protein
LLYIKRGCVKLKKAYHSVILNEVKELYT